MSEQVLGSLQLRRKFFFLPKTMQFLLQTLTLHKSSKHSSTDTESIVELYRELTQQRRITWVYALAIKNKN